MPDEAPPLPEFVSWPTFPFEGDIRVKPVDPPTEEPPRQGEDPSTCTTCSAPDDAYVWVAARWRVRALDRPTGLPMVLILESRSHLDLGDLPNLLAAELGVMVVRLERAIRSLEGVARVHVNRWGDGSAHLHLWFLARPTGRLQLRGTFLSLWDDILPPIPEDEWRNNLALVAAWLADFGGRAVAAPSRIDWKSFSALAEEGAELERALAPESSSVAGSSGASPAAPVPDADPSTESSSEPSSEPTSGDATAGAPGAGDSGGRDSGGRDSPTLDSSAAGTGAIDSSAADSPTQDSRDGDPVSGDTLTPDAVGPDSSVSDPSARDSQAPDPGGADSTGVAATPEGPDHVASGATPSAESPHEVRIAADTPAPGVLDEWSVPEPSPAADEPTVPVEAPKAKPRAPRKRAPRKAAPAADTEPTVADAAPAPLNDTGDAESTVAVALDAADPGDGSPESLTADGGAPPPGAKKPGTSAGPAPPPHP